MTQVVINIVGIPAPQGSMSAGVSKSGKAFVRSDNPMTRPWRSAVAFEAKQAMVGKLPLEGPLRLTAVFQFPRPRSHYRGKSQELKAGAPLFKASKPDVSKLVRAVEDALTGIVYCDDARIAIIETQKVYADEGGPCATLVVEVIE